MCVAYWWIFSPDKIANSNLRLLCCAYDLSPSTAYSREEPHSEGPSICGCRKEQAIDCALQAAMDHQENPSKECRGSAAHISIEHELWPLGSFQRIAHGVANSHK